MARSSPDAPRGLLRPQSYGEDVRLHRAAPSADLVAFVEVFWSVAWQLPAGEIRTQETLPYPAVHLVVEDGGARVYGVPAERFTRRLTGSGWALGVKFVPGGFRPLLGSAVSGIRGQVLDAGEVLAGTGPLVEAVLAAGDDEVRVEAAEEWLRGVLPEPDPAVAQAGRAVAAIAADPALLRVEELARSLGTSVRSLQRLFSEYVGASPKWVLRRFRMHEAADRAAAGPVDWAALAADLGYFDQPHFVRDFTATVGVPPQRYAQECAEP